MPVLFREMIFCECGRPAMHNSPTCRTCYEDGLRRQWREDFRLAEALSAPAPLQMIRPPQQRLLFVPVLTKEDAARIRASLSMTK